MDNGITFLPNDRYLLENEKFRLYPQENYMTLEDGVFHAKNYGGVDKSVYHYYSDFAEKGYYNRISAGNINQVLKVDSVVCDFNAYPYRAVTYATQKIIRQATSPSAAS